MDFDIEPEPSNVDFQMIGAAIRAGRLRMGLSQEDLAAYCQCSTTYLSRVENGHGLGMGLFIRFCRFLGISMDELLGLGKERDPSLAYVTQLYMTHSKEQQEAVTSVIKSLFDMLDAYDGKRRYGSSSSGKAAPVAAEDGSIFAPHRR